MCKLKESYLLLIFLLSTSTCNVFYLMYFTPCLFVPPNLCLIFSSTHGFRGLKDLKPPRLERPCPTNFLYIYALLSSTTLMNKIIRYNSMMQGFWAIFIFNPWAYSPWLSRISKTCMASKPLVRIYKYINCVASFWMISCKLLFAMYK